jgi:hypothetical protein
MSNCYTQYLTSTNSNTLLQNLILQLAKDLEDYYRGVPGALSPTDSITKYKNSLKVLGNNYSNDPILDSAIKAYVKCIVDKYTPTTPPPTKFPWWGWLLIAIGIFILVVVIAGLIYKRTKVTTNKKEISFELTNVSKVNDEFKEKLNNLYKEKQKCIKLQELMKLKGKSGSEGLDFNSKEFKENVEKCKRYNK